MADVDVATLSEDDEFRFRVVVAEGSSTSEHEVSASRTELESLAHGSESPADVIRRAFAFLLDREPKESILRSFELSVISSYFPEFEQEMRR